MTCVSHLCDVAATDIKVIIVQCEQKKSIPSVAAAVPSGVPLCIHSERLTELPRVVLVP